MKLDELILILKRLYRDYVKRYFKRIILSLILSIIVAGSTSATAWLLDPAVKKIFIDQNKREKIINREFFKILNKRKLIIKDNPILIDEVVNLVDSPNILLCKFDKKYLSIPKEILILTMQSHQKYFPTFDDKNEIGYVTSKCFSPRLEKNIGYAFIPIDYAKNDTKFTIKSPYANLECKVVSLPFYDPKKQIPIK